MNYVISILVEMKIASYIHSLCKTGIHITYKKYRIHSSSSTYITMLCVSQVWAPEQGGLGGCNPPW